MTNNELTLDQLQTISGGLKKPSCNLKELADSGKLVPRQMKFIPGDMYGFIPGEMY